MNYIFLVAAVMGLAFVGGRISSFFKLPRVTGYILTGLILGPAVMGVVTREEIGHLSFINEIALGIIAFYIGTEFESKKFRKLRRTLPLFFVADILVTSVLVFLSVVLASRGGLAVAVFLGILSIATAPAATLLVLREYDSEGPLTDHIKAMVGLNNLICIIAFVISLSVLISKQQSPAIETEILSFLSQTAHGILVPIILGMGIGIIMHYYLRKGLEENELLMVSLTGILLGVGLSIYFSVSGLLTNLTLGGVLVNICDRAKAAVKRLGEMDYPLYALFFALAGASLHLEMLEEMGVVGAVYILSRGAGKVFGGILGGKVTTTNLPKGAYLGMSLLPQAGLAIGLSSWAAKEMPALGTPLLSMILATTVVFEVIGPVLTRLSLVRGGEVKVIKIMSSASIGHLKADLSALWDRVTEAMGKRALINRAENAGPVLVKHLMRYHIDTIPEDATLDKVIKIMQDSRYTMLPVVGKNNEWKGLLTLTTIRDLAFDKDVAPLIIARDMAENVDTVRPGQSVAEALHSLESCELPYLPVVDKGDHEKFLGVIHRRDVCLYQLETEEMIEADEA